MLSGSEECAPRSETSLSPPPAPEALRNGGEETNGETSPSPSPPNQETNNSGGQTPNRAVLDADAEMPILDAATDKLTVSSDQEAGSEQSAGSPPPSSPPRMETDSPKIKMKDQTELLAAAAAPLDVLKSNPFLLPAQFLALNPNLYAAQLAQLQAAQLMLARHQQEALLGVSEEAVGRKRSAEEEIFNFKQKFSRDASPPPPVDTPPKAEKPLDLSGNKSPELKAGSAPAAAAAPGYFNPLMPAGLLSFFNQLRPPQQPLVPDFSPRKSPSLSPPAKSPWQSQWSAKGGNDNAKPEDVFKCVWCKESYGSLEALTTHMKEAKHHAMPGFPPSMVPLGTGSPTSLPSHQAPPRHPLPSPTKPSRDILREQMPLPRKLVRGQDVWIGRADEQTRDILKCMGCGQSFRSLDLLTKHMQETQHYKKVISHDQVSSWKYPDHAAGGGGHHHQSQSSAKNHVNSVLTCKVCDKGFSSLKDLSDHMVRSNHYAGADTKSVGGPSARHHHHPMAGGGSPTPAALASKDRKKALPVKKLLELERARQEVAGNFSPITTREIMESGKLLCERCEEKIPIDIFIPHIQQCVGKPRFLKTGGSGVGGVGGGGPGGREPASSPSPANKDSNPATKSEAPEGSNSILGSLELLVKGNFNGSAAAAARQQQQQQQHNNLMGGGSSSAAVSSPASLPPRFPPPQFSPDNKFSISSMFPPRSSPSASPVPLRGTLLGEKLAGAMSSAASAGPPPPLLPKEEDRQSPAGSDKSRTSPKLEEIKTKVPTPLSSPGSPKPPVTSSGSSGGGNPLAQLQMFCDDQKKSPKNQVTGGTSAGAGAGAAGRDTSSASPMSDPGAILAFSWACNQAQASGDSAIKCPFCDTPFISKGAYRHHLSKMHFTKENLGGLPPPTTAAAAAGASAGGSGGTRTPSPDTKEAEESLQSKYHKYSQLAKQLSCCEGTN